MTLNAKRTTSKGKAGGTTGAAKGGAGKGAAAKGGSSRGSAAKPRAKAAKATAPKAAAKPNTAAKRTPKKPVKTQPGNEVLLKQVLASLADDKAEDIVTIDLSAKSPMADYMVVASGRSSRHVAAIAEHLKEMLKKGGILARVEGLPQGDWVLIDAMDVIVHVFRPEVRSFYNLEKMWKGGAPAEAG